METKMILPELDMQQLNAKANEFAMKGALKAIEDYYCGYNSPFQQAISAALDHKEIGPGIRLPDIVAIINDSLSKEIDAIVNRAIAETYIPMVHRFFLRAEKEMKFSELLARFISENHIEKPEDCSLSIERHIKYGWIDVTLEVEDKKYEICLHQDYESKKTEQKKYSILSLPREDKQSEMTLSVGDASLKIPFTQDILKDGFNAFIATLIIGKTLITMDCEDFEEEMFPERCHC